MYETFNRNFQNVVPDWNTNTNPYQDQYFGENDRSPYIQAMNPPIPGYGGDNSLNNAPYPIEPSLSSPNLGTPITVAPQANYMRGGKVQKKKKGGVMNHLPSLAEMIRSKGEGEDKILAHINPEEAEMLAKYSGGDINPVTGLPQFGLFSNPKKWLKGSLGGGAGALIGNMILPGVGGIIGGALGGVAGSALRGRKDFGGAALRGAGMGALIPSAASILGAGANSLGFNSTGNFLSKYGAENAIMPSFGRLIGNNSVGNYIGSIGQGTNPLIAGISAGDNIPSLEERTALADQVTAGKDKEQSFIDKLMGKSSDFFSNPMNLLSAGVLASSFLGKKSPRKRGLERAKEEKAYLDAMKPTEKEMLAEAQAKRRVERNKFLPEERLGYIEPLYRKTHTPEEYKKYGKWLSYYNNPQFAGEPVPFKKGGKVPSIEYEVAELDSPSGIGYFLKGQTSGQDDKIPALLSDGEFVIPADVVAHAGDGNNAAGAKKFDELLKNIRKHKGGSIKLPPKAKSLASYMR